MLILKLTLTFLLLLVESAITSPNHNVRILDGQKAEPGQFPFLTGLFVNIESTEKANSRPSLPYVWCSAAILDKYWAVIPAHCIADFEPENYCLLAGTNVVDNGGVNYTVSSAVFHPNYTNTGLVYLNDVALLNVEEGFALSELVKTVEIGEVEPNEQCTIMGWGQLDEYYFANELYYTQLDTITDDDCRDLADTVPYPIHLGGDEICTFSADGVSVPCNADAGPLLCGDKVAAMLSYAIFGCDATLPIVYTRLAYHEEWINSVINS